jgi:hypothetical protein
MSDAELVITIPEFCTQMFIEKMTMIPLDELLKTLFGILYSTSFETPLV